MKLTLFVLTLVQASLVLAQDQSASEKVANDQAKRTDKQTLPNLDYRKVEVIAAVFAYVLEGSVQGQLEARS